MLDSELIESLKKLNFTEQEAIAYITLLTGSPMSGYAVATSTGIQKSHVYEVLESLVKKGCVSVSHNTTSQYVAISYENFLARYQAIQNSNRRKALKEYEALMNNDKQDDVMWNLYRVQDIHSQLINLIDSAKKNILLKLWGQDLVALEASLQGAYRRGVKLFIIVLGEYSGASFPYYHYKNCNYDLKKYNYRSLKCSIDKEIVCCCSMVSEGTSYATWTSNPLLFMPIHASLCMDMSIAKLYKQAPDDIKEQLGEDLANLRVKYI